VGKGDWRYGKGEEEKERSKGRDPPNVCVDANALSVETNPSCTFQDIVVFIMFRMVTQTDAWMLELDKNIMLLASKHGSEA